MFFLLLSALSVTEVCVILIVFICNNNHHNRKQQQQHWYCQERITEDAFSGSCLWSDHRLFYLNIVHECGGKPSCRRDGLVVIGEFDSVRAV